MYMGFFLIFEVIWPHSTVTVLPEGVEKHAPFLCKICNAAESQFLFLISLPTSILLFSFLFLPFYTYSFPLWDTHYLVLMSKCKNGDFHWWSLCMLSLFWREELMSRAAEPWTSHFVFLSSATQHISYNLIYLSLFNFYRDKI